MSKRWWTAVWIAAAGLLAAGWYRVGDAIAHSKNPPAIVRLVESQRPPRPLPWTPARVREAHDLIWMRCEHEAKSIAPQDRTMCKAEAARRAAGEARDGSEK